MDVILKELLIAAVREVLDLVEKAIDGDDDASRRLDEILNAQQRTTVQKLRAQRMREKLSGGGT